MYSRSVSGGRVPSLRRSEGARSAPYSKPIPPRGDPEQTWKHDLFSPNSDVDNPQLAIRPSSFLTNHQAIIEPPRPSPSLRPYGELTPAVSVPTSSVPLVATAVPVGVAIAGQGKDLPLHMRITSIKGIAGGPAAVPILTPTPAPVPVAVRPQLARPHSRLAPGSAMRSGMAATTGKGMGMGRVVGNGMGMGVARSASEEKAVRDAVVAGKKEWEGAMKMWTSGPVDVEVVNLADGTSEDDVRTAFADFGDITSCTTTPGPVVSGQATLRAHITFTKKEYGLKAVESLDGALADGLQLGVKVLRSKLAPPKMQDFVARHEAIARANFVETTAAAVAAVATPAPPTGKLRSDLIADPRVKIITEPTPQRHHTEVQMREPTRPPPTLEQRLFVGGGGGGGDAMDVDMAPPVAVGSGGGSGSGFGSGGAFGGARRAAEGGMGQDLLRRMGGPNGVGKSTRQGRSGGNRTGGSGGAGNGAPAGGATGAGSLLSRMAAR